MACEGGDFWTEDDGSHTGVAFAQLSQPQTPSTPLVVPPTPDHLRPTYSTIRTPETGVVTQATCVHCSGKLTPTSGDACQCQGWFDSREKHTPRDKKKRKERKKTKELLKIVQNESKDS